MTTPTLDAIEARLKAVSNDWTIDDLRRVLAWNDALFCASAPNDIKRLLAIARAAEQMIAEVDAAQADEQPKNPKVVILPMRHIEALRQRLRG